MFNRALQNVMKKSLKHRVTPEALELAVKNANDRISTHGEYGSVSILAQQKILDAVVDSDLLSAVLVQGRSLDGVIKAAILGQQRGSNLRVDGKPLTNAEKYFFQCPDVRKAQDRAQYASVLIQQQIMVKKPEKPKQIASISKDMGFTLLHALSHSPKELARADMRFYIEDSDSTITQATLRLAQELGLADYVEVICTDATNTQQSNQVLYDTIISNGLPMYQENYDELVSLLAGMLNQLKPGGKLITNAREFSEQEQPVPHSPDAQIQAVVERILGQSPSIWSRNTMVSALESAGCSSGAIEVIEDTEHLPDCPVYAAYR